MPLDVFSTNQLAEVLSTPLVQPILLGRQDNESGIGGFLNSPAFGAIAALAGSVITAWLAEVLSRTREGRNEAESLLPFLRFAILEMETNRNGLLEAKRQAKEHLGNTDPNPLKRLKRDYYAACWVKAEQLKRNLPPRLAADVALVAAMEDYIRKMEAYHSASTSGRAANITADMAANMTLAASESALSSLATLAAHLRRERDRTERILSPLASLSWWRPQTDR